MGKDQNIFSFSAGLISRFTTRRKNQSKYVSLSCLRGDVIRLCAREWVNGGRRLRSLASLRRHYAFMKDSFN